ncbi:MAG: hypothetical protein KKH94_12040, partial [Candidatus Omnitrophica bacterium]|nr:hypothetical protein [Candidatus Omnitrophota bacterium]
IQDKKERGETVTLNALKADMTLWRQKLQNNEWIYEYSYDEFYQRFNIPLYIVTDSQISLREGQKALYYGMPRGSYVGGATALGKTIGLLNASIAEMRIAMQEGKDIEDLNIPAQMIMADVPAAVDKYVNGWTGFNIRHEYLAAMGGSTIVNLSEIFAKHDWNELEKSLDKNNLVYVVDPEQNGFFGLDINRMERENPELKKKLLAKLGNIKIDESDRYFSLLNQYITSNPTGELTFPKEKLEKFWTFLNELKELSKMKDFWLKDDNAYQVLTDENELKKYTTLSKKGEPKLYRMFFYRNGKDLMVKTSADLEDYLFKRAKKLGIEKEGEIESLISSFAQEPAYEGSGDYAIYNRDVSTTENAKGGSKSAAKHSDKVLLAGLFYKAREHMVEIYYGKGAELIPIAEGTEVREDELIVTNKDGKFKIIQGEGGYLAELEIRATKFNKEIDEKIARTFGAEREALVKRKEKERQWLQKALQETHERFAYECPEFQNLEKSLTTDSAASTVLFTQSEAFNRKNQQKIDLDALRKEHHSKDNASIKNLTGNEKGIAQFRAQIWVERDVEGKERIYIKTPNGMALSSYKTKEGKIISLNGDGHEGAAYLAFDQLQELEGEDVLILGNATIRYEKDTDTGIEQIIVKRKTIAAATSATFSAFEAENTGNAEESVDPLTWNLHNLKNFGKMSGRKALQEIVRYHTNVMARPETIDANAKNHNENVEWYENEEQAQQALYDRLMGLFDMRLSGVVMDETNGISRGLIHELKRANIRYMKFGERIAAAESIKSDVASMNAIVNRIRTAKREKDNTALAKEYDHLRNNDMFAQMSLWVNENTKLRERGKDLLSFIEFQEKCTEEEIKNELAQYEKVTTADERQSIERRLEQMQDEISIVDEEVEYHYKLAEKSETDEVLKVQSNTVIHITTNISPTVVNAISKVTSKAGIAIIGTNVETIKQGWDTITNIVKNALFLGKERTLSHTQAQQAIQNEYNKAILDEFHALDDAIAKEKYEKTFFYKAGTSEERDMYECITVKVIKGRVTIVDSYELAAGATVHFLNKERTRANLIFPLTLFANATNRDLNELIQMRGRIARQDGVLGHVFLYFDKKKAKDRIEEMMKHEVIKDTLKQTMRRFSDKFQTSLNDPFTRNELTGGGDGYIKHSAHDVFAEALEYFKKAERVGINNLLESELMILNAACTSVHNSSSEPALHKIREALGSHMDQYLNELMGKKPDGTLFGSTIEENGVERPLREEELSGVQRIMMYGYRMYKNPDAQDKADMKAKALRLVIGKDRVTQSVVSELGREIFVLENLTFHLREFIDNDTAHFNSEAAELDNVIVEQKTEEEKELAIVRLRQMKRKIARLKEYQRQFSQHGRIVEDIHRAGIQGEFDALHDSINVINENVSRDDIPQHVENLQRTLDTLMDYDMANTKNHTLARRALTQLEKNYAVVAEGIKDAMGTNRDLAQANTVIVQAIRKAHIFLSDNTQEKEQIEVAREEKFESALAEKAQALPFFRHTSVADTLHKATDLMGDTTKAGWVQARFQTGGEEAAKELPTVSKVEQQTGQHFVQNEIKKVQNNRREAEEGTEGMKERLNEFENRVKDINKEMDTVAESPIARSIEAILQLHEIEDSSHISDLIGDLYQKHETTKDILNNELDKFFTKHGIEKDDIKKSIIDLLDIFRMQSEILDKDDMVNQFNNTLTEKGQAFLNMVRSFSAMVIPAPGAAPPDEDDMVYFLSLARMFGFISQDEEEKKEIAMGTILNVAQKLVTIKNSEINFKNISASLNKVRITVEALRVSAGTAALQEADFLSIIRSRNDPLTGYSTPFNVRLAEGIDQKQGAMKSLTHYIRHQKTQARTKQWQREKMQNLSREIELRKKHRYGKWKTTTVRAHYGIEKLRYGLREARELLNSKIGGFLPYGLRNPIDQMKDPRLIDLEHMVRNADRQHPPSTLSLYAVHNNKLYNDIKRIREVIMQYSKQYPNVPALQAASLGKMHISDVLKLHKKINVARSNLLIRRKDSNDAPLLTEQAMQKAVEAVYADMIQEAKQAKWQKRRTVLKTVYTVSIFIGFIVALLTPGVAWGAYQIGNVLFSYLNFAQAAAPFWGTAISGYMGIVLTALIGFLISGNQFTALLNNKQTQRIPGLTKVFNTMGKGIDKVNALGKKEKEDKPLTIIRSPLTVMQFIPRLRRRLALTELRDLQTKISDETLQATLLLMRTKLADTTVPVTVEAVKNIRDILRKMRDYVNAKKEADKYPDEDKGKEKDQMAQMMAAMGQEGAPEDPEEQKKKAETEKKKEIAKKALETAQTALHAALTAYDTGGKLSDYVKLRHE